MPRQLSAIAMCEVVFNSSNLTATCGAPIDVVRVSERLVVLAQ